MTLDELLQIESIRRMRLLGSRYLDTGRIDELVDLYTEDAVCEFGPYGNWEGQETFRTNFAEAAKPFHANGIFSSTHAITNHVVELTAPDTATGLVYLMKFATGDQLREDGNPLHFLGVYDEEYRREGEIWRIRRQALNFIGPQRTVDERFVERQTRPAV